MLSNKDIRHGIGKIKGKTYKDIKSSTFGYINIVTNILLEMKNRYKYQPYDTTKTYLGGDIVNLNLIYSGIISRLKCTLNTLRVTLPGEDLTKESFTNDLENVITMEKKIFGSYYDNINVNSNKYYHDCFDSEREINGIEINSNLRIILDGIGKHINHFVVADSGLYEMWIVRNDIKVTKK